MRDLHQYGIRRGLSLALPALTLGWQVSFLWHPDLSALVVLTAAVLVATAAMRLALLMQRTPKTLHKERVFETAPTDTPPSPTSVAH